MKRYLQVTELNLGKRNSLRALEEFFYAGGVLSDLLQQNEVFRPPQPMEKEAVWVVNPAFNQLFMQSGVTSVEILEDSPHWVITAFQHISHQSHEKPIFLGAADNFGNFVICRLSNTIPPNGYFAVVRILDHSARSQTVLSAKSQSGVVAILDWDTGRESGDIEQFLNQTGIAHSPLISVNKRESSTAVSNLIQLVQMVFSIEYRTLYSNPINIPGVTIYTRSIPWFLDHKAKYRSGFLASMTSPELPFLEVSAYPASETRKIDRRQFLITIAGNTEDKLLNAANQINDWMLEGTSISEIEQRTNAVAAEGGLQYRVCLVADSAETLQDELEQAKKGIPSAWKSGKEWQSRGGSYFAPLPLGSAAKIAFVYPGAFNSYVGMGAELLHRFPFLHDWLSEHNDDAYEIYQAENLFPKTWGTASDEELEVLQRTLLDHPLSMLFSGTAVAGMYTYLLEQVFDIHPDAAYGYSLGEITMFFATGLWRQTEPVKKEITTSNLYKNRIAGSMDAVREFWDQMGFSYTKDEVIWNNMILMTNLEKVAEAVAKEPMAYLTHINTYRQVVIGGEPEACNRVVNELGCMRFPIPVNYPMHCVPVASEFETLRDLNMQSIEEKLPITYYSSYHCGPYEMEINAIAEAVAGGLVNRVDFDALTQKVFEDGYPFFIEVGARSNCSKWIERSLKSKHFCATSVNQAEIADEICLMKVIARLVSHGKKVKLPVVN